RDPKVELERTEFVRVTNQHSLLRRIVDAAEIDTVVDSRLVVDSTVTSPRKAHENNVIGTMNLLAACSGPDSTVRKFVFKSSAHYYGCEQDDPGFFTESMGRPHPPRTRMERDIVEAEATVADFAEKSPDVSVAILRFANVIGPTVRNVHGKLFSLPVVPMILGFDPRYQFVHEDDVVSALDHVVGEDVRGIYNVAGDGVLALTEVVGVLGKTYAPVLPPWGTGMAASVLNRLGVKLPPEVLQQMRFGRGLDNRKLKATGFRYRYTTRETVLKLAEHQRLHPIVRGAREPYRYEREVEDFLRWSPHVRNPSFRKESRMTPGEMVELQKMMSSYGDRVGSPGGSGGARRSQSQAVMRAAEAGTSPAPEAEDPPASAIKPRARRPATSPKRGGSRKSAATNGHGAGAPVAHYDDLDADEIVTLLDSLEDAGLDALLDYERANRGRPRVVSAIEGTRARREAGQHG
ncbi:MAG: UDP-glucose 4-epimerase, partial [Thermoleophilaceae bacterium]|nr:UDP-glucose 4-epimerase [Thermoleophilaceae bacterium]